jgi:hypothetical protein
MADNKKSFVMYADWQHGVKHLTDEQAGKLLKHILSYVNDENPVTDDLITNISFEPIKQALKRDLKKWEGVKSKRSEAGKASVEARKKLKEQELSNLTSIKSVKQDLTNLTVSDNVNVNDNVSVNDNINKKASPSVSKFNFRLSMTLKEFNPILIDDWLKVRKTKKASNTKTALNAFLNEIKKSGRDKNDILKMCVENSWAGFKSEWLKNPSFTKPQSPHMNLIKDADYSEEM